MSRGKLRLENLVWTQASHEPHIAYPVFIRTPANAVLVAHLFLLFLGP
jgi:hypothetical protein